MTTARAMPCPDCCNPDDPCAVGTYDFATFATGTTVGEGFVEDSGDWTIDDDGGLADPQLWCDGPQTNAQIRQGTDQFTNGIGSIAVTFTSFDESVAGTTFRVIGAYTDDDNFLAARVAKSGGGFTFTLIERSGGTDTNVAATNLGTLSGVGDFTVSLCWNGTEARAMFSEGDIVISGDTTLTGQGTALRATIGDTTLRITHWNLEHISPGISPDCAPCADAPEPESGFCFACTEELIDIDFDIMVTISGIESASCDDQTCEDLDGDYVLSFVGAPDVCRWTGELDAYCDVTVTSLDVWVYIDRVEVRISWQCESGFPGNPCFGTSGASFSANLTGPVTCASDLDGLELEFITEFGFNGDPICPPDDYATQCQPVLNCSARNATVMLSIVP